MCCESFDMVGFDLGPLRQGQTRIDKLKSANNLLIIGPTGLNLNLLLCRRNIFPEGELSALN